ncbi:hypothetical protein SESBI_44676 [Sesbania bispinosa]|nr:hypothetical protein SESBI_44676 [Sesbania bispinosa]
MAKTIFNGQDQSVSSFKEKGRKTTLPTTRRNRRRRIQPTRKWKLENNMIMS